MTPHDYESSSYLRRAIIIFFFYVYKPTKEIEEYDEIHYAIKSNKNRVSHVLNKGSENYLRKYSNNLSVIFTYNISL